MIGQGGNNNRTVFIEDDISEQQLSDEDLMLRERLRAEMRARGGVTDEDIEKAKKEQIGLLEHLEVARKQ